MSIEEKKKQEELNELKRAAIEKKAKERRYAEKRWYVLFVNVNHERNVVDFFKSEYANPSLDPNSRLYKNKAGKKKYAPVPIDEFKIVKKEPIEAYVPIHQEKRQWSDRVKIIDRVLTPGLIFVRIALDNQSSLYVQSAVKGLLYDKKLHEPVPIPDSQMQKFRKLVDGDVDITMEEPVIGDKVRILSGQFKGMVGILKRVENGHKFQLVLNSNWAACFSVDKESVVKAPDDAVDEIAID